MHSRTGIRSTAIDVIEDMNVDVEELVSLILSQSHLYGRQCRWHVVDDLEALRRLLPRLRARYKPGVRQELEEDTYIAPHQSGEGCAVCLIGRLLDLLLAVAPVVGEAVSIVQQIDLDA